jgi:membrane protein implicated in regulation of membrane protease activity
MFDVSTILCIILSTLGVASMYSFFVLGQVPGTGITISFTMWLMLSLVAATLYIGLRYRKQREQTFSLDPTIAADEQTVTAHYYHSA